MGALIDVILPVFLVIAAGYVAVWKGFFSDAGVDGLMRFTQTFAFPALLFRAIAGLDLAEGFHLPLLASFYIGAVTGFGAGLLGARFLFGRPWEDSVAIGFVALFSNTLMLGVPITERAFGPEALAPNFAIISVHTPFCYCLGIVAMEFARGRSGTGAFVPRVVRAMFHNALVIGIVAGFAVNLSGLALPGALAEAIDLLTRAALPAALFGLGGILVQYRPEGDLRTILYVCAVSLVLHPAVTWGLAQAFGLGVGQMRSSVLTAAMAPGVNAYVFANLYGVAKRVAASSVLIATALSLFTAWGWLALLP
ncbi:MAG: AEC family transporter [Rhodobacteraceae bacterium]|nr:AEC family transporter [Paracoccaceae bacterium]